MKMNNICIVIVFLFFIANVQASVSNGPYIGAEIGTTNQTMQFNSGTFNTSNTYNINLDNSNWALVGRLNLGYNIDKYNGFELGYNYNSLSSYTYPNNTGSLTGNVSILDASYLLYLPTTVQKLSVFGRIGVAYDWINGNSSNAISPSGSNFADVLGAGIKYNISPKTSLRVEWFENGVLIPVSINSGAYNIANFSEQTFMLGLNYHF